MMTQLRSRITSSPMGVRVAQRVSVLMAIPTVVIATNYGAAFANGGLAYQRR